MNIVIGVFLYKCNYLIQIKKCYKNRKEYKYELIRLFKYMILDIVMIL